MIRNIVAGASDTEFEKVTSLIHPSLTTASVETHESHLPPGLQRTQGKARHL